MRLSRGLPPVELWRGVKPRKAANSRPLSPMSHLLGLQRRRINEFVIQGGDALLRAQRAFELIELPDACRPDHHGVRLLREGERRIGQWIPAGFVAGAAEWGFFELERFVEAVQHLDRFLHDLRADAVTGQHCYLHFGLL
jgi:hypothetical protein